MRMTFAPSPKQGLYVSNLRNHTPSPALTMPSDFKQQVFLQPTNSNKFQLLHPIIPFPFSITMVRPVQYEFFTFVSHLSDHDWPQKCITKIVYPPQLVPTNVRITPLNSVSQTPPTGSVAESRCKIMENNCSNVKHFSIRSSQQQKCKQTTNHFAEW